MYEPRFSFDCGSGVCLWARNDAARGRFGYPVDHWELPLSENTRRWLTHLVAWYDTSIDWESPGDTDGRWSEEELERFKAAAERGAQLLRAELPASHYVLFSETAV